MKVEICRPIRFERYVTNYGGPLRKASQVKANNNYQLIATVLVDVCYRIYGEVAEVSEWRGGTNHRHTLQAIFDRRLKKGQFFYTPFLGWKEFVPTYFGPLRPTSDPHPSVSLVVPALLEAVFEKPGENVVSPRFLRDVEVRNGVLEFELRENGHDR